MTTRIATLLLTLSMLFVLSSGIASAAKPAKAAVASKPSAVDYGGNDVQDLLYLGRDRLSVIRLHIRVDGKSYLDVWNQYVDDLFKQLDVNNDNVLTGKETSGIPSVTQTARYRTSSSPASRRLPTTNRNTVDVKPRDGKVTKSELAAYLQRIGVKPFSVVISRRNRTEGRLVTYGSASQGSAGAKLFQLLDRDHDGKLSESELRQAPRSLRKHDLDEDETISSAELQPVSSRFLNRSMSGTRRTATSDVFISLASGDSPTLLVRKLINRYDRQGNSANDKSAEKDNKLSAAELGIDKSALSRCDADGDGLLDFTELRQFLKTPSPSIELVLRIGKRKPNQRVVELVRTEKGLKSKVTSVTNALANLALKRVQIDIGTDSSAGRWYNSERQYDLQFDRADTNNNGYLEKKEVERNGTFRTLFNAMDADKDGKLYKKEVHAYVKKQTAIAKSKSVLSVTDQGRDLFKILDLNRDQRLSRKELSAAIGRIKTWDRDNDRKISKAEIPRQYRLTLARGRPGGMMGTTIAVFAYAGGTRIRTSILPGSPVWFQRMDVNRDGEVSRREFLGTLKLFRRLDANKNGRIDVGEATRNISTTKPTTPKS